MNRSCIGVSLLLLLSACHLDGGRAANLHSAATAALPVYETPDLTPRWKTAAELAATPPRPFPPFTLRDQNGQSFSNDSLRGHLVVASFFYSRCSDLCPRLQSAMAEVHKEFAGDERVLLLSHTVTPKTDSVEVLGDYAKAHGIDGRHWRLLTGPMKTLEKLEFEGYLIPRPRTDTGAAMHSEMLVLLDAESRVRGVYNGTLQTEVKLLERDLRALEAERHL